MKSDKPQKKDHFPMLMPVRLRRKIYSRYLQGHDVTAIALWLCDKCNSFVTDEHLDLVNQVIDSMNQVYL